MEEKEKCFVMMPISDQGDYPEGHFTKVYEQIFKPAIESAGFEAYRVDENVISDPIIGKIFKAIQECPMALCDLSNRNPNVLYELGIRQAYDKPVVLVQDDKTERIFDVSGISTVEYKSQRLYEDVIEAREKIKRAIVETKQGKKNSIIKIIKAQTAEISNDKISEEDRIEILLSGLANDIKELKSNREYNNIQRHDIGYNDDTFLENRYLMSKGEALLEQDTFLLSLKPGITNKEIDTIIRRISELYSISISCKREGDKLKIMLNQTIPLSVKREVVDTIYKKVCNKT